MSKALIYIITNKINNKHYIGKTINLNQRIYDHFKIGSNINKYKNEAFPIHYAIAKYGKDNFKIQILEEFEIEKEAYEAEQFWIAYFETNKKYAGYNCNLGGEGGYSPNEISRAKMIKSKNDPENKKKNSERAKQYHKEHPGYLSKYNIGNQYTKGKKLSQEHKNKLSKAFIGRSILEKTKLLMSLARQGTKHSQAKLNEQKVLEIRAKYANGDISQSKLAKQYDVDPETIRSIIHRKTWKHI